MRTHDTLSTSQWTALQALFERALECVGQARCDLVDQACVEDEVLGRSLAAMLAAHEQWAGRTDAARQDVHHQARASTLLANGESIGPYRIVGVLGEGGMGVVYRAERADGEVALTAAIKVLRPGTLDAAARERFQRERDLLAGLSHPHIARLFDAGMSANGQPYFVMEYVHGRTLVDYCDALRLDVRARLRLFLDVCDAVRYAHNQLVLHRDIKPSNVLVDAYGVAKLIDFGIARPLGASEEYVAATATANRFFSPLNVAPEQLRGERVGVACDVYQLGTLLYELLCGRPVFDLAGKTATAIEATIEHQVPQAPSARAKDGSAGPVETTHGCTHSALVRQLAGDLDGITLMALRKEPARRYGSVEQLIDDIERHLDLRPVRARGSHRGYRLGRLLRRHWRALALASAAVAATIAFVATLTLQSRQLQHERDRAVAQQQRAEEATRFLVGVFKAADPTVSLSRTTPIGEVLENGRRKIDAGLVGQPQLKAELSYALADIYLDIDAQADAKKYAMQSLALRQSLLPGSMAVAESLGQLAVIDAKTGDCTGTLRSGQRALDLYHVLGAGTAKTYDVQVQVIGCDAHDKGAAYARDRMLALLDQLVRDPEATPPQVANQEYRIAEILGNLGDTNGSLRYSEAAVARLDQGAWKNSLEAMQARERLADTLSVARRFDRAEPMLNQLVKDFERIFGRNSLRYADILAERGANYKDMDRPREAEADLLEAKRIRDTARPGGPYADQARIALNLGVLYQDDFKDLARAGPYFEEAVRISNATLGPHDLDTLKLRMTRATWFVRVGRDQEAEPELQALRPELPTTQWEGIQIRLDLAAIRLKAGQRDAAKAYLDEARTAIFANPDFADMKEDLARVSGGGSP